MTVPCPFGAGLLTCRSSAPNALDSCPSVPATLIRRLAGYTAVISSPRPVSVRRTRSTSAGSAPYCSASCSLVRTVGPSTISAGSSARRRSTSVSSARSEVSSWPAGVAAASGARSLPASSTRGWDSSGMVSSRFLSRCPRAAGNQPSGRILPCAKHAPPPVRKYILPERTWVAAPENRENTPAARFAPGNAPMRKSVARLPRWWWRRQRRRWPAPPPPRFGSGAHGAPGSGGRGAHLTIPLAGPAAGEPGPGEDEARQQQRRQVEQGDGGRDDGRAAAGLAEQVGGQFLLPQERVGDHRDGQQREDPAANRGTQAGGRGGDQDRGDQQVGGQAGHLAAEVAGPERRPVVYRAEPHAAAHAEPAEDQRPGADQGGSAPGQQGQAAVRAGREQQRRRGGAGQQDGERHRRVRVPGKGRD